jgi:hypothetical protein
MSEPDISRSLATEHATELTAYWEDVHASGCQAMNWPILSIELHDDEGHLHLGVMCHGV